MFRQRFGKHPLRARCLSIPVPLVCDVTSRGFFCRGRNLFCRGRGLFRRDYSLFRRGRSLFYRGLSLFRGDRSLIRGDRSLASTLCLLILLSYEVTGRHLIPARLLYLVKRRARCGEFRLGRTLPSTAASGLVFAQKHVKERH